MNTIFKNSFWIVFNRFVGIVFPLLTFGYVSRILGASNLGKFSYATNIVDYFVLIAGLGIENYAIREGTKRRNNKAALEEFVSEMFTISTIGAVSSYIIFICFLIFFKNNFFGHIVYLLVYSVVIFAIPYNLEWYFSIFEDFQYVSFRNFLIKISSFVFIYFFVKESYDILIYVIIYTLNIIIIMVANICIILKDIKIKLSRHIGSVKAHINNILLIFFINIAIVIYSKIDIALLGIMRGDYEVGLYSMSVKICTVINGVISSIAIAAYPHIVFEGDSSESKDLVTKIYKVMIFVSLPCAIAMILFGKQILGIVGGSEYIDASSSFAILSIAMIFNLGNWFWTRCVIFVHHLEKKMLIIALSSAFVNLALNLVVIPRFGIEGAAFTTLIAEFVSCSLYFYVGRAYIDSIRLVEILKLLIANAGLVLGIIIVNSLLPNMNQYFRMIICIAVGGALWGITGILVYNQECVAIWKHLQGEK